MDYNWNAKRNANPYTWFYVDIHTHTTKVGHNWNAKRIVDPYTWFQVDLITHTTKIDHNWKIVILALLCT